MRIDELDVKSLLTESVKNATGNPDAQPRPGQLKLAKDANKVIQGDGKRIHLAGKAPTGVGKALAGLVPAALLAVKQGGRTIISTESLALQGQMVNKDFPAVAKAVKDLVDIDLSIAVLKGWSNYVCLRQAINLSAEHLAKAKMATNPALTEHQASTDIYMSYPVANVVDSNMGADADDLKDKISEIGQASGDDLLKWATSFDHDGDIAGYPHALQPSQWSQISTTTDVCPGNSCPLFKMCYAQHARSKAASSEIVVTNHSVLAVQATKPAKVIHGSKRMGNFDALIVDEAHALPDAVRKAGAVEVSAKRLMSIRRSLERFVPDWEQQSASDHYHRMITRCRMIEQALDKDIGGQARQRGNGSHVEPEHNPLIDIEDALNNWIAGAKTSVSYYDEGSDRQRMRARSLIARLDTLSQDIAQVATTKVGVARWYEFDFDERPSVKASPVNVGGQLASKVYARSPVLDDETHQHMLKQGALDADGNAPAENIPVVMLSATLPPSFPFDAGLRVKEVKAYESPFSKAYDNSLLFVPSAKSHNPPINDWGKFDVRNHPQWALELMIQLIEANQGHALVLSSTSSAGRKYAEGLREASGGRWEVHSQWDGRGKDHTTAAWREDSSSVLVGTRSYMTGVDAPGKTCSLVIVDRVPRDPNNVVDDARAESMAQELSISSWSATTRIYAGGAATLLEQAAGRLIRSIDDTGVVAILDPRLLKGSKLSYNEGTRKIYMDALAAFTQRSTSIEQVCKWLGGESSQMAA